MRWPGLTQTASNLTQSKKLVPVEYKELLENKDLVGELEATLNHGSLG